METLRSAFPDFFKANAVVVALFLAGLAISSVQNAVIDHPIASISALAVTELCIVLSLAYLHRDQSTRRHFDDLESDSLTVVALHGRFGGVDDFDATERIYLEWFKPQLSVDDGEYCAIMGRGEFLRVVDAEHAAGSERSKVIAGYYSVWTISLETFRRMADGKLPERKFKSSMILSPADPEAAVLYVPEICVSKREWEVARGPLMADLARYVGHLLRQHPHIQYVAAWPYTNQGMHHVEKVRMTRVGLSWFRKFYWATRIVAEAQPLTRRPFKPTWTIRF